MDTAKKPSARRPLAILGGIAVFVLVVIGGYLLFTAGEQHTDDAQVRADVIPVAARVGGQIVRVAVIENQIVAKGDLIAEIDDRDLAARKVQAEAELAMATAQGSAADAQVAVVEASSRGGLASAQAMFSGSSAGVSTAEAQVAAAKAAVTRAEAEGRRAEADLERAKKLREENAVPQQRLDDARAAHDSAQANMVLARAQLNAAEEAKRSAEARVHEAKGRLTQSEPIDAQIAAARANADLAHAKIKASEAALDLAELQLSYCKITAPAAGNASQLGVHEGQLVGPGQPILRIVPTETYVIANFKETQIGEMKAGQRAEITLDAFPGTKLAGKVESLSGGTGASFSLLPADNATGNFVKVVQRVPVRIAWDRTPESIVLRSGLSAEVTVDVDR